MRYDTKISYCDLLLLTGTRLTPSVSDDDIREHLYPLILNRQDSYDRFCSLAFSNKTSVLISDKEYLPVINALMFTVVYSRRENCEMKVMFLYRKKNPVKCKISLMTLRTL